MKSSSGNWSQVALCALVMGVMAGAVSPVIAGDIQGSGQNTAANGEAQVSGSANVAVTPPPQIDGVGTIAGPNGREAQFFIFDVENEQVTANYLEGEFGYSDHKSHITFTTGKIQTVTINGNQGAFTGIARIGGRHKQTVQFTVSITANQSPASGDTFSISLSNGYSASGNLTSGKILIRTLDPD